MATKEETTTVSSKPPLPLQENGGETLPREDQTKDIEAGVPQVKTKLQKEKKIGHRRVDASTGQTTYKKTPSSALSGSIQRGISHTVAGLSSKPERDVLMQDFQVVETISFPSEGSNITPAHHFGDFTFRTYAPTAFRYFRDLFGIRPDDYMLSISQPLIELSNPGASGSLFFVTQDDEFIIKTVQHKEAEFLQKLLPGYYMNLVQNPRTLLPKFYGLYCVQSAGKNIRIVVMNNLLPRKVPMHLKYDLKGSTFKRKASKYERAKKNPVYKDLDLINDLTDGLLLDPEIYSVLVKTMQRDCLVLQSFKIMDYSLLLAIHNLDQAEAAKAKESASQESKSSGQLSTRHQRSDSSDSDDAAVGASSSGTGQGQKMSHASRNAVVSSTMLREKYSCDLDLWAGGIPAKNKKGDNLLLFCGIIDILQCYKLKKKLEHTFKSMIADGDMVSVHRPAFYCKRFQAFMTEYVFKRSGSGKPQSNQRLKSHSTRRIQNFSSNLDTKAGSSVTLPASAPSSVVSRLQGRPDLLPSESPRPLSVAKEDDDTNKQSELYGNQPVASASSPAQLLSKGVTSRKEITREVKSENLTAKQPGLEGSIAGGTLEVGEGGEAAITDVLRSSQVDLSIEENVEQKPAPDHPHAENQKVEVKTSGQSSVVYHDTAF